MMRLSPCTRGEPNGVTGKSACATPRVPVPRHVVPTRVGSVSADREWFMPWRTIEGEELAPASTPQLQVLIQGLFEKRRLLDFLRYFIVFEDDGRGDPVKKIAGYHQFNAV